MSKSKFKQEQAAQKALEAELKAPDEFQKLGETAVPWLEKHIKTVLIAGGAVLGAAAIYGIASSGGKHADTASAQEFSAALEVLSREVNVNADAKAADAAKPPFKSEQDKDDAIVKTLTEFRSKNGGKPSAVNAALPLAQAYLRQGKAGEALPLIEEFLKSADAADPLRAQALEARGYALEGEKKYDEAIAAFDQLATENKTDFLKGMGQYHHARLLLLKGDTAGAAKGFSEIEAIASGSSAARLAKDRIAALTAQGVAVPKPVAAVAAEADAGK